MKENCWLSKSQSIYFVFLTGGARNVGGWSLQRILFHRATRKKNKNHPPTHLFLSSTRKCVNSFTPLLICARLQSGIVVSALP